MDEGTMNAVRWSGCGELADFDLGAVARGLFRFFEEPFGNCRLNVVLAAVGTDLSRNAFEHDREAVAYQRNGCGSQSGISLFAHYTLHSTFLLNPEFHWIGSGS
jgi:hypothetical protein